MVLLPTLSLIVLLFLTTPPHPKLASAASLNDTDKAALLTFKSFITEDPFGVLSSWNESVQHCLWTGVTCGLANHRVIELDLNSQQLSGTIPPCIGNLSFLYSLNLAVNSFHGPIPSETGKLIRLQSLNLSHNLLGGRIPIQMFHCSSLLNLSLSNNHLIGKIPHEVGTLSLLRRLSLATNNLTGNIPDSIGNITYLVELLLSYNKLEGEVPASLGQLRNLMAFQAGTNSLSGEFPPFLYNLSSLRSIALPSNNFSGKLRPDIGLALPRLQSLALGQNHFSGAIPASLSNASYLRQFDIPINKFTGAIPSNLGTLQNLQWLNIPENSFSSNGVNDLSFLTSLTNCSKLRLLDFSINQFAGVLPNSIGNLSTQITWLHFSENRISGEIPPGIGNLANLTYLDMKLNILNGRIPALIGKLSKLRYLTLGGNNLTGEIPASLGNLTNLLHLHLYKNTLKGSIPSNLGSLKNLNALDLSENELTGTIPREIMGLTSLNLLLNLSTNTLTGTFPHEVGNLTDLVTLHIANNNLSGEIPHSLGKCMALNELYMQGNTFHGSIPDISALKDIKYLDLSANNLSGQIPKYFMNFTSLLDLNLSFNNLEGEVPAGGIFKNESGIQLFGNNKLCGGIQELTLPLCILQKQGKNQKHIAPALIGMIVVAGFILLSALCFLSVYSFRKSTKTSLETSSLGQFYPQISYRELFDMTNGFSSNNCIGSGNFGTVYKGVQISNDTQLAIKVFNLCQPGASKSFLAECQASRDIRHNKLVKVLTVCSSSDSAGNDFKALVYELMPNGSLEKWLHPQNGQMRSTNLDFVQRLNISIDVASALSYLHNGCEKPVIHCDLKPSNILLDCDLSAHVTDFGLAKLLPNSKINAVSSQFSSIGVRGTTGYAPPEYGLGARVSTNGDVYSYGILLLEMFTGKRPTDETFKDDLNLRSYTKMELSGQMLQLFNLFLSTGEGKEAQSSIESFDNHPNELAECLSSVLVIGLACSEESPGERMRMRDVELALVSIRDKYTGIKSYKRLTC